MKFLTHNRVLATKVVVLLSVLPQVGLSADKGKQIDKLVTAYHAAGAFSGSVLVAASGKVVYEQGVGVANRVWDVANSADTRFLIGSATKQFTAVLVMQLAAEGKLDLDGVVTDYLPHYRHDTGGKITLYQLLTHTSGLPNYFDRDFFDNHKDRFYSHEEFLEKFLSMDTEPVSDVGNYSSANYYLLGLIIEETTGKPYEDVLKERILDQLNMDDTGVDLFTRVEPKLASGYIRNYLGYHAPPFEIPESSAYAAGAMYSTIRDLYKFDQALYTGQLLDPRQVEALMKPRSSVPWSSEMSFSLGSMSGSRQIGAGEAVPVHEFGGNTTTGFTALVTRVPKDRHLVVILCNAGPGYFNEAVHDMADNILSIIYGHSVTPPKAPLAIALGAIILDSGTASIAEEYERLKSTGHYTTNQRQINRLGYNLLQMRKAHDAVAVFELCVKLHPESANAYDSLAEGYLALGQTRRAEAQYERAISLDPNGRTGQHARQQLERIRGQDVP